MFLNYRSLFNKNCQTYLSRLRVEVSKRVLPTRVGRGDEDPGRAFPSTRIADGGLAGRPNDESGCSHLGILGEVRGIRGRGRATSWCPGRVRRRVSTAGRELARRPYYRHRPGHGSRWRGWQHRAWIIL